MTGSVLLMLWFAVWVGFIICGVMRNWSAMISIGGGFLVAGLVIATVGTVDKALIALDTGSSLVAEGEGYSSLIIVGLTDFVLLGIVIYGYVNRCPNCKKWFSRNLDDKELIDSNSGYETVTRYDVTRDTSGREISRTQRQEQVRVTRNVYNNHYSCPKCEHEWTEVSVSSYEG